MSTAVSWGKASDILATAGVAENPDFYGPFVEDNERATLTIPQRIAAAWADNDADAFADIFTGNGSELIGDDQMVSQESIRSYMTDGFQGIYRGSRVVGWPISVKFLTDDVALLVTGGGVLMPGDAGLAPERELRSTWVVLREDEGRLRLVSHQSSPIRG